MGKVVLGSTYNTKEKSDAIFLFNTGGQVLVEKLEIYPTKSIWQKD